jgi:hypothetical protein
VKQIRNPDATAKMSSLLRHVVYAVASYQTVCNRQIATAQHVREQVRQDAVDTHGDTLPLGAVVLRRGGGTTADGHLGEAVKGDIVRDGGGATCGGTGALQDAVALVVVEELVAGGGAAGCGPTVHAPLGIIGHAGPVGTAAGTGVGRGRIDVATGHVAHGIVAGIRVGETADLLQWTLSEERRSTATDW